MVKSFLFGLIAGATAVWVLKDPMATRLDSRTRSVRVSTAHRLRAAADAIEAGVAGTPAAETPMPMVRTS